MTTKTLAEIGLDPAALDRTADPCTDFYQFACGGWIKSTEIPADKPESMRSFVDIDDRNLEYEHTVLEAARTKPGNDALALQLGSFYGSCMDEAAVEKAGTKPVAQLFAIVDAIRDGKSLAAGLGGLQAAGLNVVFVIGATQDSADAKQVILGIDQGGLGLLDRDYYLQVDDQMKTIRTLYLKYVEDTLVEVGHKPAVAKKEAADILALETAIAQASLDKVARRDPKATYNKIDRAGVAKEMPHLNWDVFWKATGIPDVSGITVNSKEFLQGLDKIVASTKPDVWRSYLTFMVVHQAAGLLSKKIVDTAFGFNKNFTGQEVQTPRWRRCVRATDGALGETLGQMFVRDKFGGDSKAAAEAQIHAIVEAMGANLTTLPWMDDATKVKAKEKLAAMAYQIGYPRKWRTYSFKIDPTTYGANALVALKAETTRQLARVGKPMDRDEWAMTAPTVNAYYNSQLNGMVFPAGILQPPFYSVSASIPVNLGAMGMVVGHELTHGFDDQGAQFDAVGNLTDWWQPETAKQFKARTQCVIDQYSQYEIGDHTKVNGANTVGENIADIGGVKLALTAYRSLRKDAPDTVVADGFTEDQQFFLGFGQAWCEKARPDYEKLLVMTDVHAIGRFRVNGSLSDTAEFAKVWSCKAGAKMVPAKACTVW